MMKNKLLGAIASGALLVTAAATAHATPYGFANSTFNNFSITLGGTASVSNGSVSVSTSQNYPGSSNTGNTNTQIFSGANNTTTGTVSAANAFGGPDATYTAGNPAGVTTSTPAPIGESSLKGGNGAQAAASVGGLNIFTAPGDGSYGVVENGGVLPFGSITSNASQRENLFTITTGAGTGTVTFSFLAQAFAEAETTVAGETASASATNTIAEFLCGNTSCSTGNTQVGLFAPPELQVSATSGPTTGDFMSGNPTFTLGSFNSGAFTLLANSTYQFALASVLTESTSTPQPAPEPLSIAVLGTGLLGLARVARRRRNKA